VSSESVVVHSVSKADFESRFFKEFYSYMTAVYDIKKKQRDITIENIKKDFEAKADDLKFRNPSIAQNNHWQKSPIKVPALENFTPYLHKKSASFKLPKGTSLKAEALPFSAKINEQDDDPKTVALAKEKKNFMPDLIKSQGNSTCDLKTLESMKLFETEPKKGKKKNQFADIGSPKTSALKSRFSTEGDCSLAPSPLQDLTKDQRKLKTMRLEDKDQFPSIEKIGSPTSSFSSVKSFEFYKPRPNSLLPSLNSDSKKNQNAALVSFVNPKSGNQSVSEESQSGDPTSPQLPLRKLRTSNFEKPYKPSQFRERSLNQSSCMFNSNDEDPVRGDYGVEMESEERFETMKKPLNFDRDLGEVSTMTEKKNSMIVPKDWLSTFKKSKSSHNVRLQKAKDWRSKIFQKTAFGQKIGPQ